MAVRLRYKASRYRQIDFPDSNDTHFTAQDFPDGRIEVTQHRKGRDGESAVVATYSTSEVEVVDRGWPTDE